MKNSEDANALDADRAEIMAVIEADTTAWLRKETEAQREYWVQAPHTQHISIQPTNGARQLVGYDEIFRHLESYAEKVPDVDVGPEHIRRENWRMSISSEMAWVTFDQIGLLDTHPFCMPGLHRQARVMEKVDGRWKIAACLNIQHRTGFFDCPWLRIDSDAKVLEHGSNGLAAVAKHPALEISAGRLIAHTSVDRRRLKDAIATIECDIFQCNAREPVPLVFDEGGGTAASLCWVTASDMMIVVLLNDDRLVARSIEKAAEIYGLSPAQMKVTEEIARGRDLTLVAETLGVSANTVRTHVKRMFERVGVNSQASLLRAVLSAEAPSV